MTVPETKLWRHLRAKQIEGIKFRRQEPIGKYVADFLCYQRRIVIELDGGQHSLNKGSDLERDKWFEEQGYKVIRFWNAEVLGNLEGVLKTIWEACNHPPPPPSRQGRGEA